MNKRKYMDKLLLLCTEKQKNIYNKMYPDGPSSSQLKLAINQIENTLRNLNFSEEKFKQTKKEYENSIDIINKEVLNLNNKLIELNKELKKKEKEIEMLSNPISIKNKEIQERLNLLNALEIAGVDNWEWYGDAIDIKNNN